MIFIFKLQYIFSHSRVLPHLVTMKQSNTKERTLPIIAAKERGEILY